MREQPNKLDRDTERGAQRLVILQLLDGDRERWTRRELEHELATIEQSTLQSALGRLQDVGLVQLTGEVVRPSRAACYLSELDLIAL